MKGSGKKTIADNRKARHEYSIEDDYEAGMVLQGTEVKSLRNGQVNLSDSYAKIIKGEVFVYQMNISPYKFAYYDNHDPLRPRKLLLHNYEIKKLIGKINEKGYSLIPLSLYFSEGKVKMKLGLARGKKLHDKRNTIKERDAKREMDRIKKIR
ncbi:SsrA-binding protein SmpB [Desulforegula conservatrix]|uniref:SsrA-binding protein SmpB n=1 Tax=Desulforegula conservatrix TaxID=153026 RepID=UPI000422B826|nr:SsrA-binding protein SmpB [Desulforegula conservatrix]